MTLCSVGTPLFCGLRYETMYLTNVHPLDGEGEVITADDFDPTHKIVANKDRG